LRTSENHYSIEAENIAHGAFWMRPFYLEEMQGEHHNTDTATKSDQLHGRFPQTGCAHQELYADV
jgi:hypothetical protein